MKKIFKILIFISLMASFISCKTEIDSFYYDKNFFDETNLKYPNALVIPDKYNTGVKKDTHFSKIDSDGYVGDVYFKLRFDENNKKSFYIITSYSPNLETLPDETEISDYDFSDAKMVVYNPERYKTRKKITFRNCKFKGFSNGPAHNNKVSFVFDHCTFQGGVSEAQIELNHCYIGGFITDGMNPTRNFKVKNSYIADLVTEGNDKGTHIDGFQIFGRKDIWGGYIYFDNVRFEIPSIFYENQTSYVNASIMFQLEFGNVDDCLFKNIIVNGGGKWFPIYLTRGKPAGKWAQRRLTLKNVRVSDNFGKIFYTANYDNKAIVENVRHCGTLYVSSVWKDESGKTHIICTNDSMYKRTLLVKANNGKEYRFPMPRCPSNWNLGGEINRSRDVNNGKGEDESFLKDEKGKSYKTYRFSDMPFDIDCVIEDNVNSITCYDENEGVEIRKVRL